MRPHTCGSHTGPYTTLPLLFLGPQAHSRVCPSPKVSLRCKLRDSAQLGHGPLAERLDADPLPLPCCLQHLCRAGVLRVQGGVPGLEQRPGHVEGASVGQGEGWRGWLTQTSVARGWEHVQVVGTMRRCTRSGHGTWWLVWCVGCMVCRACGVFFAVD